LSVRAEQRRQPRLLSTCRVEIGDRFTTWSCETVNIGPRGCLLITPRWLTVGALLTLRIASDRLERVLEVAGQVVWTEKGVPCRAGVTFTGSTSGTSPTKWFDSLTVAEIEAALRAGERTAAFGDVKVYLGPPPAFGRLDRAEIEVVRLIGTAAPLAEVLERAPGAVRSLLARGRLTLARIEAVDPGRWTDALSREPAPAMTHEADRLPDDRCRSPEFEMEITGPEGLSRVLERAVDALLDGDVRAAEGFLRKVRAIAPEDSTAALILRRIGARSGRARRGPLGRAASGGDAEAS
jgi:PilZ domain